MYYSTSVADMIVLVYSLDASQSISVKGWFEDHGLPVRQGHGKKELEAQGPGGERSQLALYASIYNSLEDLQRTLGYDSTQTWIYCKDTK